MYLSSLRLQLLYTLLVFFLISCSEGLSEVSPTKQKISKPQWIWVSGGDSANQRGNYGTQGEVASSNIPGAREDSISWVDSKNNLWLYGGRGFFGAGSNYSFLSDLWVWDGTNWTWIAGSNLDNEPAVYGTKGIPDPNNTPGAREDAIAWTDSEDVLWLFGGLSYPDSTDSQLALNDLWSWKNGMWTWVAGGNVGNEAGVYGSKGQAAATNSPGARDDSLAWVDSSDNLWLFGGGGFDGVGNWGDLNDLWRWDRTNWTWIAGANTRDEAGIYGNKGEAAAGNTPGAREDSIAWVDDNDNFWIFGGLGADRNGSFTVLNDLWRWDGAQWTWISGSNVGNQRGTYGSKGVPASDNQPGSRTDSIAWVDSENMLWLFGGSGFDKNGATEGYLGDLWRWDGTQWTWVSGSDLTSQRGVYGTQGKGSQSTIPGSRLDSIAWIDNNDNFWIFGGDGYDSNSSVGTLNDLWQYKRFELVVQ